MTNGTAGIKIERVEVDLDQLAEYASEEDFTGLAVELLVEVNSYVCVAACLLPVATRQWDRNQAIVAGNVVRLYKLISGLLDQTCQHRRETSVIFARLAFEAIVNIAYLVEFSSPQLFDSYIRYSMKHERRLHDRIMQNVVARGGQEWPIERRMISSIERAAQESGVPLSEASASVPKNWGDKNLFERAKAVGFGEVYLTTFSGPSHSVHGNWMDLLEYHLDQTGSGYGPALDWQRPRPQILLAIAHFCVDVIECYFKYLSGNETAEEMNEALNDLALRVTIVNSAHEEFVTKRMQG
jgi:uncharacterized protein DUF5677